ncbi:MAG TPA: phosphotransferase family protein [Streptosporangiaceae bacterium]|nr:phosphotransferase family protein [Streptosporangiaceae bacterium]
MSGVDSSRLATALRPVLGDVSVSEPVRLSGGASRETWAFDAAGDGGPPVELVLRRDPPGRPGEPGAMGREAQALRLALAAGLAVPEVLVSSDSAEPFGTPGLVMRRVGGETIARRILRDDLYAPARSALSGQLGRFAAGLHALPVPAGFPEHDPLTQLQVTLGEFGELGQVSEVFELAVRELAASRPAHREPVIVHGDLRLGNLIVAPSGLAAVIDWELVHAGNPAEDLGWLCVKAWRFGAAGAVAGLGSREELLTEYRTAGGAAIGLDELRWWEILGTLRWGVICLTQAWAHLSGAHRSVELAAIGRRVCEQEWDLLGYLRPEAAARAAARRPQPGQLTDSPYGRPTARELLDAVREFLTSEVMPGTSGQLAFHARVAANALAIVSRELDLGPLPAGLELADVVAARLAVANPRYFDAPKP